MIKVLKILFVSILGLLCCACLNVFAVNELNSIAQEYMDMGDVSSAISRLEASNELDENNYETRYMLTVAYMANKQCNKALEHAQMNKELAPDEPVVYKLHGQVCDCLIREIENIFNEDENKKDDVRLNRRYIKLLTDGTESFEKYIALLPGAEDTNGIIQLISINNDKIKNTSSKLIE